MVKVEKCLYNLELMTKDPALGFKAPKNNKSYKYFLSSNWSLLKTDP
jgi:hypothetical protein